MKKLLTILALALFVFVSCEKSADNGPSLDTAPDTITLSLGAGYSNDIYYNVDSGIVATVSRTNWDIAFHTGMYSSTIITNGGSGVNLYAYPKGDTASWSSLDTSGIKTWKVLYNSDTTWLLGAFERNASVHPDYGWGVYNSDSHDLIGDSLFVIKLANGQYKKLWIKKKLSSLNKYIISYADLNNTNQQNITIDCSPYTSKNFVYFSLTTNSLIDREPKADKWDFVITKYMEMISNGQSLVPYPVLGVLTNTLRTSTKGVVSYSGVKVAQKNGVDITSNDYSTASFQSSISIIGSDWKSFDMGSNQWTLMTDVVYFLQRTDNKIYKLYFTKFAGSTTGSMEFVVNRVK
jgi:hypothetical protein